MFIYSSQVISKSGTLITPSHMLQAKIEWDICYAQRVTSKPNIFMPPPPSVVIRRPAPHCLIATQPPCHTATLAACCTGWVWWCAGMPYAPLPPPRFLKRRARSRPGRLALPRRPPFSNQAGKPCANEGGGRGGDRGNEAGRPGW